MEESGEQCTVVFALTVTEPALVRVWRGGDRYTLPPLAGSVKFMQRRQCIVLQIPPWQSRKDPWREIHYIERNLPQWCMETFSGQQRRSSVANP